MVALNGGRPELMNLKDLIRAFIEFREEVVTRRTKYLLNKARERAHVLCGLAIAVANIDEVIRLIRTAPDPNAAREALMGRDWPAQDIAPLIALVDDPRHKLNEDGTYRLSEAQARAILDLRLQRLTRSAGTRSGTSSRSSPTRSPTTWTSCAPAPGCSASSARSSGKCATSSPPRARPRSSTGTRTWTTRT
jgi:DNA gyrase/topoisomerase IV subunit A